MNEFSLIKHYFTECGHSPYPVDINIGDDAAVLPMTSSQLVMTMDTLIENVHFPFATTASDIAHKALAVNLSDLAAMGATPAWFLLSLSLPDTDATWLTEFSLSLKRLADQYAIKLIGGDTCKGALSITIQATGVLEQKPLLRSSAQVGDHVFVSGTLGLAALGLAIVQHKLNDIKEEKQCLNALNCPTPRFDVVDLVKPFTHAMIDVSDGLLADLKHILSASQCGADIFLDKIPLADYIVHTRQYHYALSGGDDYELCFTVPEHALDQMNMVLRQHHVKVYDIGRITKSSLQVYTSKEGNVMDLSQFKGFQHFG